MQNSPVGKAARLGAEAATTLSHYGARTTWPAGFQIYQKGTPADGLSMVLRGHVVLRSRVKSGRGFVPAIVIPGETFGMEGISPGGLYVTDACASEDAETLFVTGAQFRAFVRENPGQAIEVMGQMMSERVHLLEKLHAMASQNVEQRLVVALKRLAADRSFRSEDGSIALEPKHHRLLCEMVGATRESIALALGRLVGCGVAERRGMVFVVAPAELKSHISGNGVDLESSFPVARETMTT
ncbi:MAG: Crp/Fnr family transcriptional regulator [Gemmatimonadaceae bacterium]